MKIGDDGNSGDPLSGSNYTGAVIYPGVDSLTDRISEKAWVIHRTPSQMIPVFIVQ